MHSSRAEGEIGYVVFRISSCGYQLFFKMEVARRMQVHNMVSKQKSRETSRDPHPDQASKKKHIRTPSAPPSVVRRIFYAIKHLPWGRTIYPVQINGLRNSDWREKRNDA